MPLTPGDIRELKASGKKIAALTAYDCPSARLLDEAGIDIILVGDSLGMVLLGFDSTREVTMEHMLHHTQAAARGVKRALLVADMPYLSYETPEEALQNARRLCGAGAQAVKLEGGEYVKDQVSLLIEAGIPVMGHTGMTPQSSDRLGGYRVVGKESSEAAQVVSDSLLLDRLGVFSLVLECIPAGLARKITGQVQCPTIGIGAGPGADGQILVLHDMLGIPGPVRPRFVREFANVAEEIRRAAGAYRDAVRSGTYPSDRESYQT